MSKIPKLRFKEFSGEWETHLLGKSIILYDNERKPVKEQERNSGVYAYYGATGIIDYIDNYIFEGEYLLLGEDGANIVTRNAPLIYKTGGKFWVNNHAHIFKPKTLFNIDFMKQRLELINYIPYNTGTAQPKLNADSIKSIPFNAPSKEEQEKIASFFSLIDDKISLQNEKVEALKDYKKGMMQKIFSRELRFKDDEGRNYPEWEEKKLGDVSDVRDGTHDSPKYLDEGFRFITSKNLSSNGKIDFTDINYISEEDYININKRSKVDVGDILFGMIGTIGNPVLVEEDGFAIKNVALIKQQGILLNKYLIQVLNSSIVNKQFHVLNSGGTQKFIALGVIRDLIIPVPVYEEQLKIIKVLSNIDLKIEKEQEKLDSLNEYKKGLLQQMFI